MTKYNFDETFHLRNKATGETIVNDVKNKRLFIRGALVNTKIADFAITDVTFNDSTKDIDNITLLDADGSNENALPTNNVALLNKIATLAYPNRALPVYANTLKKYMIFSAVNEKVYDFIVLLVRAMINEEVPTGRETITLAITTADTTDYTNGCVTVTATDEDSNPVQDLEIELSIGSLVEDTYTTNSSGVVQEAITTPGTYTITAVHEGTTSTKPAEDSVEKTVAIIKKDTSLSIELTAEDKIKVTLASGTTPLEDAISVAVDSEEAISVETDAEGVWVDSDALASGEHTVVATYAGNDYYNTSTQTETLTVEAAQDSEPETPGEGETQTEGQ